MKSIATVQPDVLMSRASSSGVTTAYTVMTTAITAANGSCHWSTRTPRRMIRDIHVGSRSSTLGPRQALGHQPCHQVG